MARALLGYVGSNTERERTLAVEVVKLRRRVAALEAEVEQLRERRPAELDLELHTIAETKAPALT